MADAEEVAMLVDTAVPEVMVLAVALAVAVTVAEDMGDSEPIPVREANGEKVSDGIPLKENKALLEALSVAVAVAVAEAEAEALEVLVSVAEPLSVGEGKEVIVLLPPPPSSPPLPPEAVATPVAVEKELVVEVAE